MSKAQGQRRRSLVGRVVYGLLAAFGLLTTVGAVLLVVAVRVVRDVGAQVVGTMIAEFAAFASFLATLAALLLALSVLLVLQTPPLAAPFNPVAQIVARLVVAWLGQIPG